MHQELKTLIDKAAEVCGGGAGLADRIGMHQQGVSALMTGRRAMTPEIVALLCDVLEMRGEECRRLAALAVMTNPKNAKRTGALREAFFGCSVSGAAACMIVVGSIARQAMTMYRLSNWKAAAPRARAASPIPT